MEFRKFCSAEMAVIFAFIILGNMHALIKDFLEYNHFANKSFISSFVTQGFDAERGIKIFSHIINAHHIWLARMKNEMPAFEVWEIHVINSFMKVEEQNFLQSIQLLQQEKDLNSIVSYTNTKGNGYQNSLQDILLHIINHSTYHRGQLALLIRESGIEPPSTDYILYKRDQV